MAIKFQCETISSTIIFQRKIIWMSGNGWYFCQVKSLKYEINIINRKKGENPKEVHGLLTLSMCEIIVMLETCVDKVVGHPKKL